MIWYVEAMIKISEDFMHVVTYDAYKPRQVSHVEKLVAMVSQTNHHVHVAVALEMESSLTTQEA